VLNFEFAFGFKLITGRFIFAVVFSLSIILFLSWGVLLLSCSSSFSISFVTVLFFELIALRRFVESEFFLGVEIPPFCFSFIV
jgi:hypothetical protein